MTEDFEQNMAANDPELLIRQQLAPQVSMAPQDLPPELALQQWVFHTPPPAVTRSTFDNL